MNLEIISLLLFVIWTIGLGLSLVGYRTVQVLLGKKQSNEFPAGIQHGPERYWRLNRAHANCLENLPIFATIVIVATLTGSADNVFGNVTLVIIGARVFQSVTHIISGSSRAVDIRFTAYVTQVVCFAFLIWKIFT
ncbi:MAPEG family protein [Leptospira ilyithenensis]|uniref:MAPEG family protein n=1 Tax=Leptospira ilyithenensis TaxID=2484901 RepID=A0A4R9LMF1_9LEPT|nr:MAPEG family protein [Leptospira ilyithenensis]TGN09732.1 MAPEG family protein [Leptospira ilyithenensis]